MRRRDVSAAGKALEEGRSFMRRSSPMRMAIAASVVVAGVLAIGPAASGGSSSSTVWPTVASGITYATPSAAARGLALDLLGMETLDIARFRGTATSGTVTVRPTPLAAGTVVSVVRGASGWMTTGSTYGDVRVTAPRSGDHVATIVTLRGRSTAFEGVVNYVIRTDAGRVLAHGTVMGGSNGVFAAFHATVRIPMTTGAGEVILLTKSASNGLTLGATIVRVAF